MCFTKVGPVPQTLISAGYLEQQEILDVRNADGSCSAKTFDKAVAHVLQTG